MGLILSIGASKSESSLPGEDGEPMRDRKRQLSWVGLFLALALGMPTEGQAQAWSPDGSWLAFETAVRAPSNRIDWLLGQEVDKAIKDLEPSRYQLWATRVATDDSVLLFESEGALTSPSWSPDGKALAFGHLVKGSDQGHRFELIVQEAPDHRRVLRSWELDGSDLQKWLEGPTVIGYSADGSYLAVAGPMGVGVAVLKSVDGQIIREFPDGSRPVWAPEANLLALVEAGEPPALVLFNIADDQNRRLAEVPGLGWLPPPVWSRRGDALYVLADHPEALALARPAASGRSAPGNRLSDESDPSRLRLERIDLADGNREAIRKIQHEPLDNLDALREVAFGIDRQESDLFYTTTVAGSRSVLTWGGLPNNETFKHYNPLQWSAPIHALAISPNPLRLELALRFQNGGRLSPPNLSDPRNDAELRLIVADEDACVEWIEILLDAIGQEVELALAAPAAGPARVLRGPRPTRLPVVGDLEENNPSFGRLRRLAAEGLRLCDRLDEAGEGQADWAPLVDVARVVFTYFPKPTGNPSLDYAPALSSLERLERHDGSADQRSRLLGLRAQIAMARGELARAEAILSPLLKHEQRQTGQRIEQTARGPLLAKPSHSADWTRSLADRLLDLMEGRDDFIPLIIEEPAASVQPAPDANAEIEVEAPAVELPPRIPLPDPPPRIRLVPQAEPAIK